MDVTEALLDSWDRQCRIVNVVAERIDDSNKNLKPAPDSMPIFHQLAHMQNTRRYFLGQLDEEAQKGQISLYKTWDTPPSDELALIRQALKESGEALRKAVAKAIADGNGKAGWYDNPVLYLQHMVWHEGWHIGMIFLALRLAGQEPPEEWEEEKVWGEWRTEVWEG